MRLIDPIELKRSIAVSSIIHDGKTLEQIIDAQPTIEERTGHWERVPNADNGIDFRCSACHRYRFHNGEMVERYKFCPNCGARMKGDDE